MRLPSVLFRLLVLCNYCKTSSLIVEESKGLYYYIVDPSGKTDDKWEEDQTLAGGVLFFIAIPTAMA